MADPFGRGKTVSLVELYDQRNQRRFLLDSVNGTIPTIEFEHHEVHEENFFSVTDVDLDVDIATPKYWLIRAPDTSHRIHFNMAVFPSSNAKIELFENPTVNDAGTSLNVYNNDRNSTKSTTALFYYDPTLGGDGTRLLAIRAGGTIDPKGRISGEARNGAEFILKQGEDYAVKVTVTADNSEVTMMCEFYEVGL